MLGDATGLGNEGGGTNFRLNYTQDDLYPFYQIYINFPLRMKEISEVIYPYYFFIGHLLLSNKYDGCLLSGVSLY